ncbi:MAG: acyl-CoA dehydrogenase family protein [Actinomycetota bacterium]
MATDVPHTDRGGDADVAPDMVDHFLPAPVDDLHVAPLLDRIEAQAESADRTRRVAPDVVAAIKDNDFMRSTATREIGGVEDSMHRVGRELAAIAERCPSLAWTLWNHVCVFHLFAGSLGPDHADFLTDIVEAREWVSFPAGAGSGVRGRLDGDRAVLNGKATWSTGAQYGDWCGVVFAVVGDDGEAVRPLDLRFTMIRNHADGVKIDPTWDGGGLRASATDDIHYTDASVGLDRCVAWFGANRAESLRVVPVINHRYREDWVGLSDLWLGWMAVAVVRRAVREAAESFRTRRAIMGTKMQIRPTVQLNVGRALALTSAAHAAVVQATAEVDQRIERQQVPDAADYFRQQAVISMAVEQLGDAMELLARTHGGNGTREGGAFERRLRDFRTMPLHINVHPDRITHQLGRLALGIELDPF